MNTTNLLNKIFTKKTLIFVCVFSVLIILFLIMSNLGRYEINSTSGSVYTYTITDKTGTIIQNKEATGNSGGFIKRGDYSITIYNADGSFFQAINQSGFLQKTSISPVYKKENNREVVGYNSLECSNMVKDVLYSYVCGGVVYEVERHYPATLEQPSYSESYTVPFGGLAGTISSKEGQIALAAEVLDDGYSTYTIGVLDADYNITNPKPLPNLDSKNIYHLSEYKDGFIIHDISGKDAWYYSSLNASPIQVTAYADVANNLNTDIPIHTKTSAYGITSWQSTTKDGNEADLDNNEQSTTKIVYIDDDSTNTYEIRGVPSEMYACANNTLCIRIGTELQIYQTENKLKGQYIIGAVDDITMIQNILAVVVGGNVVIYDVAANSGYVSMRFGTAFTPCGISENRNSYTLCIIDEKLGSLSLYSSLNSENVDSIEQKISKLSRTSELESLSIYKNIIYINTQNGDSIYNPSTNAYEYNQEIVNKADAAVRKNAQEIGLSKDKYIFINPFTTQGL